jgi:general secretion pathway protein C
MTIQRVITLINLSLLTLGAYFSVGLLYQVIGLQIQPVDASPGPSEMSASQQAPQSSRSVSDYSVILERDLFKTQKEAEAPEPKENLDLENLEKTKLRLKLWGTVSGNPEKAYAVIEDVQKREQNLFRVGDTVQNATVKTILREKVVLSVSGRDEVLAMEDLQQGGGPRSGPSAGYVRPLSPSSTPGRSPARTQQVSLRRSMIENAMQDVTKLMTEIAIKPHMENGQPAGLAMSNIKPNSIFRRMGLRNGDILKGVDGQEIQSVDDALKFYGSLKEADSVNVQIQRRNQIYNLNYNIR